MLNMLCSGCGRRIPFGGQVCPYCQRDKSADQQIHVCGMVYGFVGGAVGYGIGGVGVAIVGLIIGGVVGTFMGAKTGAGKTQPPEVRIVDTPEPKNITRDGSDAAGRIGSLESLKSEGLISEAEFNAKRREILEKI